MTHRMCSHHGEDTSMESPRKPVEPLPRVGKSIFDFEEGTIECVDMHQR
jgi:hypothetical protein